MSEDFLSSVFRNGRGLERAWKKRTKTTIGSDENDGIGIGVVEDFVQAENVGMREREHDGDLAFELFNRAGAAENTAEE